MNELNKERIGNFIVNLRREKGLTQKQLAEEVFVSDKAVSKWERGLSLPDISMLEPLANVLGVTILELLQGQRLETDASLTKEELKKIMEESLQLSKEEELLRQKKHRKYFIILCAVLAILGMEIKAMLFFGLTPEELFSSAGFIVVELLPLIFSIFFFFVLREKLPYYYDIDKISSYSQSGFQLNMPGIYFNNNNWPHLLMTGRCWCAISPIIFPILYFIGRMLMGQNLWWIVGNIFGLLFLFIGLFVPFYITAKKYK